MATQPWGGSEELWSQAATRLAAAGHTVRASVAHWQPTPDAVDKVRQSGVEITTRSPRRTLLQRALVQLPGPLTHRPTERRWLSSPAPDLAVVSQGGYDDGLQWMEACLQLGIMYVAVVQANCDYWWPQDELASRLATVYREAARVFCVSSHNLRQLEYQIGESLPNARIVRNPVKVAATTDITWPDATDELRFACVARLDPASKGQDLLLRVLATDEWRNRKVFTSFYGAGTHRDALEGLTRYLALSNVRFVGQIHDVHEIWRDNHVLVLPSRFEGLPLALVEAMFCSRPAIVTNVGGNIEVCQDNVTGFVSEAATVTMLRDTMNRAWHARERLEMMGRAAKSSISARFPSDPIAAFVEELLSVE